MEISALISALKNPEIYPDHPPKVEVGQTHISVLFFTGQYVYKVKKPVDLGFLNFTTLEKRNFFCHQEVELNRRLCPEIYLGVVEVHSQADRISLGPGPGEVVEYAVWMKQLPQDCMMDRKLARGEITGEVLEKLAGTIARFHASAAANPEISSFGEIEAIRGNVEENFSQTEKYIGRTISATAFEEIKEKTGYFLQTRLPLFRKRVAAGKIRDCHGDLHLQSICLGEQICIFDCIEFNQRFRYSDVAADIAFLLMDIDFHENPDLAADLASCYLTFSRDWSLFLLIPFYKSYRAYVRGKVLSFRLEDPIMPEVEKSSAIKDAERYFSLAHYYASGLNHPFLLAIGGIMGSGKSTLARGLSRELDWKWLRSDVLRKEMADLSPREHRFEKFQEGIYSREFTRLTYRVLLDRARDILAAGESVIIDASFSKQADRMEAQLLADEAEIEFLFIECTCSEEELKKRLIRRLAKENEPSDGRLELLAEQKGYYEKVDGMPPDIYLSINTEGTVEESIGKVLQHLLKRMAGKLRFHMTQWPHGSKSDAEH